MFPCCNSILTDSMLSVHENELRLLVRAVAEFVLSVFQCCLLVKYEYFKLLAASVSTNVFVNFQA